MERRQYKNPPIEEALCEFRFAPGPEWDLTVPGRLHGTIKNSYSGKPRQQSLVEAGVEKELQSSNLSFKVTQMPAKIQFPTVDGRRLVAVGPDILSVHVLRPYAGWEEFRAKIAEALLAYQEVAQPVGVRRIGLRYINRIEVPGDWIHLNDYFTTVPVVPNEFPQRIGAFLNRIEATYDDQPIRLVFTFASLEATKGQSAFLLDLDLVWEWSEKPLSLEEAMAQVDELKQRERVAFEALITDRTREVFNAG